MPKYSTLLIGGHLQQVSLFYARVLKWIWTGVSVASLLFFIRPTVPYSVNNFFSYIGYSPGIRGWTFHSFTHGRILTRLMTDWLQTLTFTISPNCKLMITSCVLNPKPSNPLKTKEMTTKRNVNWSPMTHGETDVLYRPNLFNIYFYVTVGNRN